MALNDNLYERLGKAQAGVESLSKRFDALQKSNSCHSRANGQFCSGGGSGGGGGLPKGTKPGDAFEAKTDFMAHDMEENESIKVRSFDRLSFKGVTDRGDGLFNHPNGHEILVERGMESKLRPLESKKKK